MKMKWHSNNAEREDYNYQCLNIFSHSFKAFKAFKAMKMYEMNEEKRG